VALKKNTAEGPWTDTTWQDGIDQQKKKSFSARKYGEAQAKQMATNHRQLIEETLPHYILAYGCV